MRTLHQERETRHGAIRNGKGLEKHRMHATMNDLPQELREKTCDLCNARLADCIDLATQVKTAHWNVRGPHFIGLHKLFDEIYEDVSEHVDTIAERCAQLGGKVMGTARIAASASRLEEYPVDIITCEDHVRELSKRLSQCAKLTREAIDQCQDWGDQVTSDMYIEITQMLDQWLWFVEAHQQTDK